MNRYVAAFAGIVIFVFLLLLIYIIYIRVFRVDVVFYSAIYSVLIALVIYAAILFTLPVFRELDGFAKLNSLMIAGLIGYALAISIPTVIDRSLSFYILEKLQQRGGGIQLSKFDYIFTNEYMREHKLIDIRITEQLESSTIEITDGCVYLTEKGSSLADFSRYFRQNFLPKKRLLRGQYTDELIDPFVRSDADPDYLCD